jgi:putative membrane protein
MVHLLISWVIITVGILVAAHLIPGIRVASIKDAFIAAVILALLNVLLWPILLIVTVPITVLTFGLFLFLISFVVNVVAFWLAGNLMKGFEVRSFPAALLGSLVVSAVSYVAHLVFS